MIFHSFFVLILVSISLIIFTTAQNEQGHQKEGLKLHNQFRKKHGSKNMKLSTELTQMAQKCAEDYAKKGTIDNSCKPKGVGQNLFITNRKLDKVTFVRNAVNIWYNTSQGYNYDDPGQSTEMSGCFTQIVWAATNLLGIGVASSGTTECVHGDKRVVNCTIVSATYKPPGNVQDQDGSYSRYKQNVKRPI